MAPPEKTPYQKWQDGIDAFAKNPHSGDYDATIQATVTVYNQYLAKAPGYKPLSWRLVKAMAWTETGPKPEWKTRPVQIGNTGDPGLDALLSGNQGGELIMPPSIARSLTVPLVQTIPERNIEAGVGYLLMRAASYKFVNVADPKDAGRDYVVKSGDNLSSIALRNASTAEELKLLNPSSKTLHPGDKIKIKRAKIEKKITGFVTLTTIVVADLYNTKDLRYADKLGYCLSLIK